MKRQVTMRDIAAKAKVSVVTVSRALKNYPGLPEKTCKRIQKIAAQMGYRPNPMLSVLMASLRRSKGVSESAKTKKAKAAAHPNAPVIAFLFWNPQPEQLETTDTPLGSMFNGACMRALELGYKVELFRLDAPGMTTGRMRQLLRARGIMGIIMAPLLHPIPTIAFDWSGFACATIGYSYTASMLHRTVNDHFSTMQLAIQQLIGRNYRRIGLILHKQGDERTSHRWSGGFLSVPFPDTCTRLPVFYMDGDHSLRIPAGLPEWLESNKPDAIITIHPNTRHWLEAVGWGVPHKVGLIDLDLLNTASAGISPARYSTGINRRHDLLGGLALDLIAEQLYLNEQGVPLRPKTVMLTGDWIEGDSLQQHPPTTAATANVQ